MHILGANAYPAQKENLLHEAFMNRMRTQQQYPDSQCNTNTTIALQTLEKSLHENNLMLATAKNIGRTADESTLLFKPK